MACLQGLCQDYGHVQAPEPPAGPQGLEDLLHLLAAQQAAVSTQGPTQEGTESSEQQQSDAEAYTQSTLITMLCRLLAACTKQYALFVTVLNTWLQDNNLFAGRTLLQTCLAFNKKQMLLLPAEQCMSILS